ncbi:MAG TPA: ABC transporter permease [Acidimicrobiales bacterium]|nr:ABC transporter permease [Acidimicrobiales bacterium]
MPKLPRWFQRVISSPVLLTMLAITLGLVIGSFVIIVTTAPVLDAWRNLFHSWGGPGHAVKTTFDYVGAAYRDMFTGAVIDPNSLWHSISTGQDWTSTLTPISETLTYATPLTIASIGVGITFQTGLFNIGANGQAIIGGIAGVAVGSSLHLPTIILVPITLLAGVLGGVLTGALPGFLKSFTGAHEVIVTLMFNYVANLILLFTLLSTPLQQPGQGNDISRNLLPSALLSPLFGTASGLRVNWGVFIAAGVVVVAWWFLERSSLGFEFRVSGANPYAARVSGINPKKITILAFLISGGLAGLAGITEVAGTTHFIDGGFLVGSAGIGFTAITVSLLGRNRPVGIMWGALLFAALGVGGRSMQASTGIPLDLATVIQYSIVLFIATPVMVQEIFRIRSRATSGLQLASQGWNT